ncbi:MULTISPECIES: sigma-70 family RNA polymerase sigma factor [Streptomyces]|uniref:RNA polymerase subunit sigma-70 n=2 Tax=Streptomyces TaxID=1883 RepID=A0A514JZE6_9ACTN|nr:sigma-70 family RNA polymerase sigma factor [Streptomyces calvus]MBA8979853.1 RNA polymerase sigma-70 factor (ECF subfamily) [Streptomyces calvus]MYS30614.1 sigma-70 family RNA polymerase sigma factor [Streptomyces sp. SID7804]QDI72776.1 RNA polymerase subunit sigma-70 [Streptomyces calvus]GGP59471.1 RNA polymerase sigma factor [Streptomyces calvus]
MSPVDVDKELLARRFEEHRPHLRAVAYRMLGSLTEAEDAVQEAWLRLGRTGTDGIDNLGGWLTTVTGRICLDLLRSRTARREQPMDETFVPDPVLRPLSQVDPEQEALHADSVGVALLVVLEHLEPDERLAFVLHDMFAVPFDDIAAVVERSTAATRQLASRARRRVRDRTPSSDPDPGRQRKALDAFRAAARGGDFEALVAVLHPDVVLRADAGALVRGLAASKTLQGARAVAESALMFARYTAAARTVVVNDSLGLLSVVDGRVQSVMSVTVVDGRITGMYILADPDRLARLEIPQD